ncbi:MAG: TetR/AcrR family transcriptional regulator [Dehalococcoidales bacterium]|nr:TetR/AcrR family transcriptional regulator [Dehalococcoidales bacterium]
MLLCIKGGTLNTRQRDKILNAARRVFWRQGYQKATIKDIADIAGFKAGNIYNYFESKEELLYELLLTDVDELIRRLKVIDETKTIKPDELLRSFIFKNFLHVLENKSSGPLVYDLEVKYLPPAKRKKIISKRDEYEKILQNILQMGIDKGSFRNIDIKMLIYCLASSITRSSSWYSPKGRLSIEQIANVVSDLVLNGIYRK